MRRGFYAFRRSLNDTDVHGTSAPKRWSPAASSVGSIAPLPLDNANIGRCDGLKVRFASRPASPDTDDYGRGLSRKEPPASRAG